MRKLTEGWKNKRERGVALILAIFTLLLISALAASLVFMSNTETSVNSNYRSERVSAFGAKSGMEEIRDRMSLPTANPNSLAKLLPGLVAGIPGPGVFPPGANSIVYVVNEGAAQGSVQPWVAGNAYMDDELCHDFTGIQTQQPASDVRCTTPPTSAMMVAGETPAAPFVSSYPWAGTNAALTYKWIRITLKQNGSNQNYPVNSLLPLTTQVCWNGSNEVLSNAVDCQHYIDPNSPPGQPTIKATNPVYMITAMAVSSTGTARKMVQAEVALPPAQPFPYGLFATGTTCPVLTFSGGGNSNPATDSYNSAGGGTYSNTNAPTGGDVGANGGISLTGHAQIGGAVGVQSLPGVGAQIPCAGGDYLTSGSAGIYNPGQGVGNPQGQYPNNVLQQLTAPAVFPTPPDPTPLPTSKSPQPTNPAVPGTYGDISLSGKTTLVLAPGVYNVNSLSLSGQSSITVNPAGAVVFNFPSSVQNPISISGQGIASSSQIPNDMQLNYGGTGTVTLSGQGTSYAVVDAPNSALTVSGNGDFYGRVVGKTITYSGNGKFHFDKNTALGPQNNGGYQMISFREISY